MKKTIILLIILSLMLPLYSMSGEEILRKSDAKWVPNAGSYEITLKTTESDGNTKINVMKGFKKGNSQNVLIVSEPAKIKGSVFMKRADVIYNYFTTNMRVQKVAYQAIFLGTLLSYGDIMATELSYDYNVQSMKTVDNEHILTLTPKQGQTGYGKVEVHIDTKTLYPKKRLYYALSGVLLKTGEFKELEIENGKLKKMVQEFFEPLKSRKTLVTLEKVILRTDIPDRYFNENFIKFLSNM